MAIPFSYNFRNVIQRPVATLTTAVGIALTVAILIGALALASGFQIALKQTGSPANAMATRKGADDELSSGVSRETSDILRARSDVAAGPDGRPLTSSDVVVLTYIPRLGQPGGSNVTIRGIDPSALALRSSVHIVSGRMFQPGAAEVIVGKRISTRFAGCRIGDKLRFRQEQFTVVGLFDADGSGFESEIWGDNAVLMPVFRGDVFQSVTFRMKDPSKFEAIKKELEADPRLGIQLKRESDYYAEQSALLAGVIRFAGVFITLIMAVGAIFGAMNTMYAAVGARTREIATLLVLGFSPFSIMVSFMTESVLLALCGGVIGCLLSLLINGIQTGTTNFQTFSEVAFSFQVTPQALVTGLIFSGMMGVVGGFLPAIRAANQPLARALRAL